MEESKTNTKYMVLTKGIIIAALYLIFVSGLEILLSLTGLGPQHSEFQVKTSAYKIGSYTRETIINIIYLLSGIGILYKQVLARKLALIILVISTFFSASGIAWTITKGPPSLNVWLLSFLIIGLWNAIWFYLIYRAKPTETLDKTTLGDGWFKTLTVHKVGGQIKESNRKTKNLVLTRGIKIAAWYLIVLGGLDIINLLIEYVVFQNPEFQAQSSYFKFGRYTRVSIICVIELFSGIGILYKKVWAKKWALTILVINTIYSTYSFAWSFAKGSPSFNVWLLSFFIVGLWNAMFFYLIFKAKLTETIEKT